LGGNIPAGEFLFPLEHPSSILPRPMTDEDFAEDFGRFTENFPKKERLYAGNILAINNLFAKPTSIPLEEKHKIMRMIESENIYDVFRAAQTFKEYQKAQKYLFLALTKSLFAGSERDICDKCRKCLTVCPNKSFNLFKENEKLVCGINKKTCEYCFKCMKSCPFVNPK
jgi:NAD-dependent dihydropyrimidine dehydrogenase PreA subunit